MPSFELHDSKKELLPERSYTLPASESFFDSAETQALLWPRETAENPEFLEQSKERKEQIEDIEKLIIALGVPSLSIEQVVESGKTSPKDIAKAYRALESILKNPDYQRLALYLPFEILPSKGWKPEDVTIQEATEGFLHAYTQAWNNLLVTHDVRANFIDGDVLEADQTSGDFPRVVKATHLIPLLLTKGILTPSELAHIYESSKDPLLRKNIEDLTPLLIDNKLLTEDEASSFEYIPSKSETSLPNDQRSLADILDQYQIALTEAENGVPGDITDKRKAWLIKQQRIEAQQKASDLISELIINGEIAASEIFGPVMERNLAIEALRKAIVTQSTENYSASKQTYEEIKGKVLEEWESKYPLTQETLKKFYRHLHTIGLVSQSELDELGIPQLKFEGKYSDNLPSIDKDLQELSVITKALETNEELSELVYPIFLVYGSRLKGYGEEASDIDVAVFVRPNVSFDQRDRITELLSEVMSHSKIQDRAVQFWLEEDGSNLKVKDFEDYKPGLGESYWAHILFGSAWQGNEEQVLELRKKILPLYLEAGDRNIFGKNARKLYLEELERDSLQYRLMHTGYERFYPISQPLNSQYRDVVDGDSTFWDTGYRQAATKIFLKKVFLPNLSE